jgi:hypothetical protein
MGSLKADPEKRKTPAGAKRAWDGLYRPYLLSNVSGQKTAERQRSNKSSTSTMIRFLRPQ